MHARRRHRSTIILHCQQVTEPEGSPLQLLGKTIRGTLGGRAPHAQQQSGSKQQVAKGSAGATTAGRRQRSTAQSSKPAQQKGRFYWNLTGFPFPLGPLLRRRTIRYEVPLPAGISEYMCEQVFDCEQVFNTDSVPYPASLC